jgi:hypothetical protein
MRDRVRAYLEDNGRWLAEIDTAFRSRYGDGWYDRYKLWRMWDKYLEEAVAA